MKKLTALLLVLVMVLSLAACSGGADETTAPPETTAPAETTESPSGNSDVTVLGEGDTVFSFTVVDLEGNETAFEIHTNKTVVGEALEELGLLEGEEGAWGLMVNSVNGIAADWDADGTYWAFYINGEYAMTGVDVTDIDTTAAYSMVLTKG